MADAALRILADYSIRGIAVVPRDQRTTQVDERLQVFLTGHPIPDREGLKASRQVIREITSMRSDELLLCLISGGASALLPSPPDGIRLVDKGRVVQHLMKSGASIHEINTVRRHISNLKGGKLVELCPASRIVSLLISDVPGNRLHDIGSGLTVEDPTTFRDAVAVLKRHDIWQNTPAQIRNRLINGMNGKIPETPKPLQSSFRRVHNVVIADNRTACNAIYDTLESAGIKSKILSTSVGIEAGRLGRILAAKANAMRRTPGGKASIVGGETTVRVMGSGKGGRNQEVALSAASAIAGAGGIAITTLGTDGVDGNSNAAGAIIDGNTLFRAKMRRLDPDNFSRRNDSHTFFRKLGDALFTGPTGTNVGDVSLALSIR